MVKKHLSRLNAPKSWPIKRKCIKFIARPMPGAHSLKQCITLNLVLKELLKYAKTTREVKKILNEGKILIDKKVIKEHRFPIGIMDVIEIPETKEYFRVIVNESGKFGLNPIKKEDSEIKICKIIGKKILKKNKVQLNLYDGRNLIVDKDSYKVGDSIVFDLKNKKVKEHLKLTKGALIYLTGGRYVGKVGVIESIKVNQNRKHNIIFKKNSEKFETIKDYVFVIEK